MRSTRLALLLFSTVLLSVSGMPSESDTHLVYRASAPNHQPDSQTIASFEQSGMCFQYIKGNNMRKAVQPCIKFCQTTQPQEKGETCSAKITEDQYKKDPSMIQVDDDGNQYIPVPCECGGTAVALAGDIFNIVAEALKMLPNILCAVFLSSLEAIADIGELFIPGAGEALTATKIAVKAAKSFAENQLEPKDMTNWVGKSCGVPNWNFDIFSVFGTLQKMPDAYGTSIGCKASDPSGCKTIPAVPGSIPSSTSSADTASQTDDSTPSATEDADTASQTDDSTASAETEDANAASKTDDNAASQTEENTPSKTDNNTESETEEEPGPETTSRPAEIHRPSGFSKIPEHIPIPIHRSQHAQNSLGAFEGESKATTTRNAPHRSETRHATHASQTSHVTHTSQTRHASYLSRTTPSAHPKVTGTLNNGEYDSEGFKGGNKEV